MARYGQAFKDRAVARLLPPQSAALDDVSRDVGIGVGTLVRWRSDALSKPARDRVWTARSSSPPPRRWPSPARPAPARSRPSRTDAASRNSSASCCARTARWPRRRPCWCCQKKSRRSSLWARPDDRPRRSPSPCPWSPHHAAQRRAAAAALRLHRPAHPAALEGRRRPRIGRWQAARHAL